MEPGTHAREAGLAGAPVTPEYEVLRPAAAPVPAELDPAVLPEPGPVLPRPASEPRLVKRPASLARRLLRDVVIGGLLVACLHVFIVQVSVVRGSSMSPSLCDGDRLVVDRLSYCMCDVARFDVVVLRYPRNPGVDFVKRVIGLPGDEVVLRDGQVMVNGEQVPERFGHVRDIDARGRFRVPEDAFFVLGDNRPISCDSRDFGMVDRDLLKGKVRFCFWPLDRIGGI